MSKAVYIFGSSLMHHGIKGQEWGIQNGPPYPLKPSKDYSSTKKKANNAGNNKTSSDKLEDQDLLTRQKVKESSDGWTDREIKASNLGLKALNTTRGSKFGYDPEKGITESDRWWFFFEDQTDGCGMIADLVNQGKSKKQILSYIDQAKKRTDDIAFELSNVYKSDQFIDACISIKQKEVKHSDMSDSLCMYLCHHGIKGQEWGVQNGPPYPLNPSKDYSKAEQKANAKALIKDYNSAASTSVFNKRTGSINYQNSLISKNANDLRKLNENIEQKLIDIQKIYDNRKGKIFDANGAYIKELKPLLKEVTTMQQQYEHTIEKFTNNIIGEFGNIKLKAINDFGNKTTLYNEVKLALKRYASKGQFTGNTPIGNHEDATQLADDYFELSTLIK